MLEVQKDQLRAKLKKSLSRKIQNAQKREKKRCAWTFNAGKYKSLRSIRTPSGGEDEKILGLQKAAQLEEGRRQTAANHETMLKVKDKEITGLKQKVKLQDQRTQSATEHERESSGRSTRRFQKAVVGFFGYAGLLRPSSSCPRTQAQSW